MTPDPVDFFGNGALLIDPARLRAGGRPWPLPPDMPAAIADRLFAFWFEEIARDDEGAGVLLRPLFGFPGFAAFTLYNMKLAAMQADDPHPAIAADPSKPFFGAPPAQDARRADVKDWIAALGQAALLRLWTAAGRRPRLCTAHNLLEKRGTPGRVWRIRRPEGAVRALGGKSCARETALIDGLCARFSAHIGGVAASFGIAARREDLDRLDACFRSRLLDTAGTARAIRRLTGKGAFDAVEGSVSAFMPCLLGLRAVASGGACHSTCHGELFHSMNMADAVTILNATTFRAPTRGIAEDCAECAQKLPRDLPRARIESLDLPLSRRYIDRYADAEAPEKIRTVMILGRHVPMHYSADFSLDFPCVLQFYIDLTRLLCEAGYEVVFKAHPESQWRGFDRVLDPRARVEWRSFEQAGLSFDAVIMDNLTSSIMPDIIARPAHMFILGDGWNDRSVPPRQRRLFDVHARRLPVRLDESGFYVFDDADMLRCLGAPAPWKRERIREFFGE